MGILHLVKLSVGSESVDSLIDWQRNRSGQRMDARYFHLTRMWPKRQDALLDGGSIYWVIAGAIQARQAIAGFAERTGADGIRRCAILLDEAVVRVRPTPKGPFQGWRYLAAADAPPDLTARARSDDLPPRLEAALAEIGVL